VAHPWGLITGTNAWINFDPDQTVGLNTSTDYRIRFDVPADFTTTSMVFQINPDNEADISLNGDSLGTGILGGNGLITTINADPSDIISGTVNEIKLTLIDTGGLVAFNYRIDLVGTSCTPVELIAVDVDGDGADATVDCDDNDPSRFPGNTEVCDGKDNDCDGVVPANEIDNDGDGYRVCDNDCDDGNSLVHPGASEVCDDIDNDCDGLVNEGDAAKFTYYEDSDGDGFGNPNSVTAECTQPNGYVSNNTDCDDTDANTFPGAPELCDRKDNDCDGVVPADEVDDDGDGFTECEGDCDDSNANTFPGAPEICDDLDNNCDGTIDEGLINLVTQNHTVSLDASGNATITAADVDGGTTGCDLGPLSVSLSSFSCNNIGPNTVTLSVTDNNGNSDSKTATVTVQDNIAPEANAQNITVQLDANGSATIVASDVDNGSSDACGIASMSVSPDSFTCSEVGSNEVTLTVIDVNANQSTTTATVAVEDNVDPIALTQDITVQLDANGSATIIASDVDNGSNDACGIDSLSVSQTTFDCSHVGPNTVTLTVTDNNDNTSTADAVVTVEDSICPTVEVKLQPIEGMLKKKKGCFTVVITPEDNCSILSVVANLNGYSVTNGQIVELKKKKKYKVKLKKEGSSDDDSRSHDDGSSGRRRCEADVKFEGPDFTLTATVTDVNGNGGGLGECNKGSDTDNGSDTDKDVYVFPSNHDGHSHDNGIHRGNDKKDEHEDKGKHKSEGKDKKH
jgi:hypothetical protein